MVRQTDHTHAMDRTIDLAQQPRQHRIGAGLAAEEIDLGASGEPLVHQHRHMLALVERMRKLDRRIVARRNQVAHAHRTDALNRAVGGGDVRRPIKHRGIQPMRDSGEGRNFPIAEMACEDQRRLAVVAECIKYLAGALREFHIARLAGIAGIVIPDAVEMREFRTDAADIVPHAGDDLVDLLRRFFGEGGREIRPRDLVLAKQRTDAAGDLAEQIGGLDRIEVARGAQHADGQRANHGFACRLQGVANTRLGAKQQAQHQNLTMILPNT